MRHFLDIGTGAGHTLELLGPRGPQSGSISQPHAGLARTRIEEAGLTNCQARQADMMALPYDDNTFDAALFNMVCIMSTSRISPFGKRPVFWRTAVWPLSISPPITSPLRETMPINGWDFPGQNGTMVGDAGFQIMSCDVVSRRDIDVFLLLAIRSNS